MTEYQYSVSSVFPGVPKYQDAESSAHLEVHEIQDTEASACLEVPEDQDAEASDHPEVPVSGSRDDRNMYKTPEYFSKMDIDVENIDEIDKNICRTIYKAIDASYSG